jgi:hypothetical protein
MARKSNGARNSARRHARRLIRASLNGPLLPPRNCRPMAGEGGCLVRGYRPALVCKGGVLI